MNGAGASGGLLALALIGFIGLIGLISFSAWPQSHGSTGQSVDANLPPAKAAAPSSAPRPTAPPQPVIAHLQHRVATQPSAAGQPVRGAQKHARADGNHVQRAAAPPSSRVQQTTGGPGNSENAPGHNKGSSFADQGTRPGPGASKHADRAGRSGGAATSAPGHGHGRGHAYGHSKAH